MMFSFMRRVDVLMRTVDVVFVTSGQSFNQFSNGSRLIFDIIGEALDVRPRGRFRLFRRHGGCHQPCRRQSQADSPRRNDSA